MVTTDGAIHQQVGSLTRQGQFDRIFTGAAQQVRPIVKGDADVSAFAGAKGPSAPTPTNRISSITSIEAVGVRYRRGRRRPASERSSLLPPSVAGAGVPLADGMIELDHPRYQRHHENHPDLLVSSIRSPLTVGVVQVDAPQAEEESHSGVLWATTRTQRGAAWNRTTSSDFGCSTLESIAPAYAAESAGFRRGRSSSPGRLQDPLIGVAKRLEKLQ